MITAIIQNYSNGVRISTSEFNGDCYMGGMREKEKTHPLPKKKSAEKDTLKVGGIMVFTPLPMGATLYTHLCLTKNLLIKECDINRI